jgi:hypothetical protein
METAHRYQQQLLKTLARELFQTETSAAWHCRREASRLGDTPPALALSRVADHADGVLRELPELTRRNGLPLSSAGHLIGRLFSFSRQLVFDRIIDTERSYRGTLLGIRHGMDLVRLVGHTADAVGNQELSQWCAGWLSARAPLATGVEDELMWFARHPVEATQSPRTLVTSPV